MNSLIKLYGVGGAMMGCIFPIDQDVTLIGRDSSKCSIVYDNSVAGISGIHCQVKMIYPNVEIMDMGSKYGTYLENGIQLKQNVPYTLSNGMAFYLGEKKNKFIVKVE